MTTCWSTIFRIELSGGLSVPWTNGHSLLLSPDGEYLAYRYVQPNGLGGCNEWFEVADTAEGTSSFGYH